MRVIVVALLALAAAFRLASPAMAQWPTDCVDLNDIVEAHLGIDGNVGIYQRTFGADAEAACQNDHRDDVRAVVAWAFDGASSGPVPPTPWPATCVALNDIVEAHLGNDGNVGIYQRAFGAGSAAEAACQGDHRADVRGLFAWAFGGTSTRDWLSVSVGDYHSCALRTDREVECWGANYDGQSSPPPGPFASLTAGGESTCGIRPDDTLACWGGIGDPPAGSFSSVSVGGAHACAVRTDGTVHCWGYDGGGRATPLPGQFSTVSAGAGHTCGLRLDGTAVCWGDRSANFGATDPPSGVFTSISAGKFVTCGVRDSGAIDCWGWNRDGVAAPPPDEFVSVSMGAWHACGLRTDGTVACWGSNHIGKATPPPGPRLSQSAGAKSTHADCAATVRLSVGDQMATAGQHRSLMTSCP